MKPLIEIINIDGEANIIQQIIHTKQKMKTYKLSKPMFLDSLYNFIMDIKFHPMEKGYINKYYKGA